MTPPTDSDPRQLTGAADLLDHLWQSIEYADDTAGVSDDVMAVMPFLFDVVAARIAPAAKTASPRQVPPASPLPAPPTPRP